MKSSLFTDMVLRAQLGWLLVGLLSGCAQLGGPAGLDVPATQAPEPAVAVAEPAASPSTALTAPVLYDVLLGEIAGQRGTLEVALPHLLRAAQEAQDPRIAERALRVAVYAKQQGIALLAARRWVELDSANLEARQALAALALREGQPEEALEQLDYLLAHAGARDAQGYEQLSALLAREPDEVAALSIMGQLADRHPDNAHAQLAHARLAAHNSDWPLAMAAVERALALDARLAPALVLRAQVLMQQDQPEAALAGMAQAVSDQPKDLPLRLAYARLLVETGRIDASREQFRILARQEPDNSEVLYSLALLALEAEQYKDAEGYLKRLLKLGKHEQEARYYLGHIAEVGEQYEQAIDWYSQVESGEQWLEVQIRMARIEARSGRLGDARTRLQELRAHDPSKAVLLYIEEGGLLSQARKYEEAMALYSRVLQVYPENDDLLYARSLVAERLDQIDVAEADLRSILARNPEETRALNALGYTLADRTDRYQEALGFIERAAAQEPDDASIIDSLGWVHFRLGNLQQAREYLQRAYAKNQDSEIAAHLGEVLWVIGERDAARRIWQEAGKADPDNPVLQATIKRLMP